MSNNKDLLPGDPETFLGELHEMDLSALASETFFVAMNTGDRSKGKFICSTLCGPYSFYEMVEETAMLWQNEQVHAKVIMIPCHREKPLRWLDECTVDFIEARWEDIITEGLIGGVFDKEYDYKAGIISDDEEDSVEQAN